MILVISFSFFNPEDIYHAGIKIIGLIILIIITMTMFIARVHPVHLMNVD